ncbi:MAG TPA: hypothetical protein VF588_20395 [Pyrinomonadaceae bacterium]
MKPRTPSHALSQLDAFFVAYQERAGILMQHGVEVEVKGEARREHLEQVLAHLVGRWPRLGQTLHKGLTGLSWRGEPRTGEMLRTAEGGGALARWRNQPIDLFREPPFQLLCLPGAGRSTLAFRCHHAAADGEAFIIVCTEALRVLALLQGGETPPRAEAAPGLKLMEIVPPATLLSRKLWSGMWRYTRWLAAEAGAGRSMSLNVRAREPGDIATCERVLDETELKDIRRRAAGAGVTPAWLFAAAWVRAIGGWNGSQGRGGKGLVSLEVPVSLRPARGRRDHVGNFISPLVLFGDPSRPLAEVARRMCEEFKKQVRRGSHLGVPLFTAPARFLPWFLFRRLAVNQTSTGFATSHFTWLEQKAELQELPALSGGAFELLDFHTYTPVCLHMGAALAVVPLNGNAKLVLTYRLTAFDGAEAESLLELVAEELQGALREQRRAVG